MSNSVVGTPQTAKVTVNGVEVSYTDIPSPAGTDLAPLVMVHGTGGSTAIHFSFLAPMASTRTRVISVDLSDTTEAELSIDGLADQVEAVIGAALPGQKVTLLGYSQGAVIAAAVAARRPDVVANLILVAGWMKTDPQQLLRNDLWHQIADTAPASLGQFGTFCAFSPSFLATRLEADIAALHNPNPPSVFLRRQMKLNRNIDIVSAVESIRACTLIIGMTEDNMVPVHHSKAMFGAIADARFAALKAGHAVVFERPAQLFSLIDAFISEPDRHAAGSTVTPAQP